MRYRYLRDPLFVSCLLLYVLNRLVLKPLMPNTFCQDYLNDLICIPFWVPIMLQSMRWVGLRADDSPPRLYEIIVPLLLWSVVFELLLPRIGIFEGLAIADHVDIFFYSLGALMAAIFWRIWYERDTPRQSVPPTV